MKQNKRAQLAHQVRQLSPEVILKIAGMCDGHGILDPRALVDAGLPQEVARYHTRTFQSDGSPKGTIFVEGRPVQELEGIYGLFLLEYLATVLGVRYRECIGRGSQASAIQEALRQHFKQ